MVAAMTTENASPDPMPHSAMTSEPGVASAPSGAPPIVPPPVATDAGPAPDSPNEGAPTGPVNENMKWYVVKVQSGREETIRDAIERRVKIEGLQDCFGQILIPTEKVTEMRNNKRVVKEKKLFPGYVMVHLEFNDRMLYLFRETSGVGDFVGGGLNKPPQPMANYEVERMLGKQGQLIDKPVEKSKFDKGDRVQVKDGTFAGMEGEVKEVLEGKGALRVELTIFGRPVPVELEYWQVDYA
jgi:transcriptional antiterminator NusG